ncbi:hypothetical protein NDU88_003342 [Pleurodeles waltl]|uniref:Uncharacterized protein n=1 Tax=Pleurodeles waltl TaxID=8319 RepID=A0AAV7T531_PLEWA|nr:hypothetical protein NDU88_003342 [Pleurodeles waltl]
MAALFGSWSAWEGELTDQAEERKGTHSGPTGSKRAGQTRFSPADPDKFSLMGIQRRPAIASSCPLFLDALRSLAHRCLVRVSEGQPVKSEEQYPLGSSQAPLMITLAKAGAAGGETVSWKLKLLMQKQRG